MSRARKSAAQPDMTLIVKSSTWNGHKLHYRTEFQGLNISIENRKGSTRRGVDKDGHEWESYMYHPYGYIRMSEGTDGDHVDCYLGEDEKADHVYIVHQNNPKTGEYDEDKVMLGFASAEEAKQAYLKQYDRPEFFGSMDEVSMEKFKDMLQEKKGLKLKKALQVLLVRELLKAKYMKAPSVARKMWGGKWYIWKQGIGWRPEPKGRQPAAPEEPTHPRAPAQQLQASIRAPKAPVGRHAERDKKILEEIQSGAKVREVASKYSISRGRLHRLLVDARKAGVKISSRQKSEKVTAEKLNAAFQNYGHRELGAARRDNIAGYAGKKTAADQPYKEKDHIIVGRASSTQLPSNEYVPEDIGRTLKQHQRDFVNLGIQKFLEGKHGVSCFDGTGAGKTMEEIAMAETYRTQAPGATVFIVTESTRIVSNAFLKDGATLKVGMNFVTKGDEIKGPGIYVMRYMDLVAMKDKFPQCNLAIFDEAHNLKNPRISAKAKLGLKLMGSARNTACFTATPIDKPSHMQYICDSYNLDHKKVMKFLGYAKVNVAGHKIWGTNSSATEVAERLDAVFRTFTEQGLMVKREVPMDGMDLSFQTADMAPDMMTRYEKAIGDMKTDIDSAEPKAKGLTKAIWLMRIRGMLEEAKIPHAINAVDEALKKGRQVVMFATRVNDTLIRQMAQETGSKQAVAKAEEFIKFATGTLKNMGEQLKAKGIDFTPVFGADKHAIQGIKDFQAGKTKVLLTTPQSGGTGISLDDQVGNAPRTMVMMTPPFSAVDFVQIMGRGHRLSTKSRTETVLIGTNTYVDQWNRGIIANKLTTLGASVKGDYEALSVEDLETVENMDPQDAAKFLSEKHKALKANQSVPVKTVPPFNMQSFQKALSSIARIRALLFGNLNEDRTNAYLRTRVRLLEKARGVKEPIGTIREHADGTIRKKVGEGKWRPLPKGELKAWRDVHKATPTPAGGVQTKATPPVEFKGVSLDELNALKKSTQIKGRIFSGQRVRYTGDFERGYKGKEGTFTAIGTGGVALIQFPDGHVTRSLFRNVEALGETKSRSVYDGLNPEQVYRLNAGIQNTVDGFMREKIGKSQFTLMDVADKFAQRGFTLSLVGGAIRDLIQGKKPGDLDFIVDCSDNEIKYALGSINKEWVANAVTNPTIGLVSFEGIDVTPAHLFVDTKELHGEFKGGTFKQDSECRDFSINAMHIDLKRGLLIDSTGKGVEDLKTKTLRVTFPPSFKNNQVLRYFKFVARGYVPTPESKLIVLGRFQKAVDSVSDARLSSFWVRQIASKDGVEGMKKVRELMLEMNPKIFTPRMEEAYKKGLTSLQHIIKKAIDFLTVLGLLKARGVKVPIGTVSHGRVKLGEGKWRPVKKNAAQATTAATATPEKEISLRKFVLMSPQELHKHALDKHNIIIEKVTADNRSAWNAVMYQVEVMAKLGIKNTKPVRIEIEGKAQLDRGGFIKSGDGEKVLAQYDISNQLIKLSPKFSRSFAHEFIHHVYESHAKYYQADFVKGVQHTASYALFLRLDVARENRFWASRMGAFYKQIGMKKFPPYYTAPTEMVARFGAQYVYNKLSEVENSEFIRHLVEPVGDEAGFYDKDYKLLIPEFEKMMGVVLKKSHKVEIIDQQGKRWRYDYKTKRYEYVRKGRSVPMHPYLMTRAEADIWNAGSVVKGTLLHITNNSAVKSIVSHGFDLKKKSWGRMWGDGVYVCAPGMVPGEQAKAIKAWATMYDNPVVLQIRVNVQKVLDVDLERAVESVYTTSAGEQHFETESEYIANLAGQLDPYRRTLKRLDALVDSAYREKPDAAGKRPSERIITEETGVESFMDVSPRAYTLAKVLQEAGYDAMHIVTRQFDVHSGGAQYVVFDPKKVRVIGKFGVGGKG